MIEINIKLAKPSSSKEYLLGEICHQIFAKAFPEYFCPKVKTIESFIKEITQITNIINCPKIYLILEKSKASAELIELALRLRKYFLIVWIPETGKNLSGFPHNKANYQEVVKFQLQQL